MPELTTIQYQVLAGLLAGGSIAAVAREHKIHRSTIYIWQHDHSAFTYALKDARARHRARAAAEALDAHLSSGVDRAVNRASRNDAIRRIAPADRALVESTSAPAEYPDLEHAHATFDTFRHNSTPAALAAA